jgi:RNA polymerase sigma factor (sigma-70 family)
MPPRHAPVASSVHAWLKTSAPHRPLCERTVLELSRRIQRWQQHPGGPSHAPKPVRRSALRAREQLVRHNLGLVCHTWQRHRSSLPAHDEIAADALQEGALNLVRAAEKFDPSKGYRFSTYGTFWVRRGFAEIEQRCKRAIRFPAEKAALVLKAQRLCQEHQAATGSPAPLEWLAQQLNERGGAMDPQRLAALLEQWHLTHTASLEAASREGEEGELSSLLLDQAAQRLAAEQERAEQEDPQRAALPHLLAELNEQQRRLIWHRYQRRLPLSPAQLRRVMRLDDRQLAELEQEALQALRAAAARLELSANAGSQVPA